MRAIATPLWLGFTLGLSVGCGVLPGSTDFGGTAIAQVIPDGTLSTTVTQTGNAFAIDNGNPVGNNLFHSFSQFSVPTGGAAIFNNAATVQNIITRVTGGSLSTIDGLIQANGTANIFLINPAGIQFGANARLNLGGSFIGSTASGIKFADGFEFNAVNQPAPLLTMSVPIGLQMGQHPAPIQVDGPGHTLTLPAILSPVIRNSPPTGLIVRPGKTLALVGGDLALQGGSLAAFGGRVELGAVQDGGFVSLAPVPQGWQLSYPTPLFGDIRLSNKSVVDASSAAGLSAGTIQLQGQNLVVRDGSIVLSQNTGSQAAGAIAVHMTQLVDLSGTAPDRQFNSQIRAESFAQGATGAIDIRTRQMRITSGAIVIGFNFLNSPGGNLSIAATEFLEAVGTSPRDPLARSGIYAVTVGTQPAADLRLTTGRLTIANGAQLASSAVGTSRGGTGGNATITATDVSVVGFDPITEVSSAITAATFGLGDAGSLVINTQRLSVLEGAVMGSTTFAFGNAGDVTINATEFVKLSGGLAKRFGTFQPSSINSSAFGLDLVLRQQLGLPANPPGNAGTITLNTPTLSLDNRSEIGVKTTGIGEGGTLRINSDRLLLNHGSALNATTASGRGGNIVVNARDLLLLRQGSNITATAGGNGNGGNITINAPIIAGFENSDIIANAFQGRGGNIQITTQGIFGLQFRPQLTPGNDITASSQFGVNGIVQVNTIGVDPNTGLVELPVNLTDPSQQIAAGCGAAQGSQFVITGRGGIPENPTQAMMSDRPWVDLRAPAAPQSPLPQSPLPQAPLPQASTAPAPPPLTEATTWQRNADGSIELVAEHQTQILQLVTCARAAIH